MSNYIINNDSKYDLNYISYIKNINSFLTKSPLNIIDDIIFYIYNLDYITFDEYYSEYINVSKYIFLLSINGILTKDEITEFLNDYIDSMFDVRYKILQKINSDITLPIYVEYHSTLQFYNRGKWGYILKLYDENIIKLIINLPDTTIDILKVNLYDLYRRYPKYINHIIYDRLISILAFIDEFRKLYAIKEQREIEKQTMYKIFYRKNFPLDISSKELSKYI